MAKKYEDLPVNLFKINRSEFASQAKRKAHISLYMKTLIIHPKDSTTTFLKHIYAPILDKTIVTVGIDKSELRELIYNHDRVIMLGHGSPWGLMSVGQFNYNGN